MCGYSDYSDHRLQPPEDDGDEMTPVKCWELCMHGDACRNALCRIDDRYYGGDEVATVMGCAECERWEE